MQRGVLALTRISLVAAMFAMDCVNGTHVWAQLQVKGAGKNQILARAQFPPEQARRYDVFAVKCTHCHEMARPISALLTGITPITHSPFDSAGIKKYVIRMMRKINSGIAPQDAVEILPFLVYARELAKKN